MKNPNASSSSSSKSRNGDSSCRELDEVIEEIEGNPLYNDGMVGRAILTEGRRILSVNSMFEEITGYAREEIVGLTSQIFYPSAGAYERLGEKAYPVIEDGGIFRSEIQLRRKDGSALWVRLTGRLVGTCEESIYLWMLDDISREKMLVEELRQKSLFHAANPNVVFSIDQGGTPRDLNPGAHRWLEEHGFRTETGLFHICPENILEVVEQAIAAERPFSSQVRFRDRFYRFQLSPFSGERLCYVNVIDETEQQRLLQENRMFFTSFCSATQAMIITDLEGEILYANREFLNLYGFRTDEVLGSKPSVLNPGFEAYADEGFTRRQYDNLFKQMWENVLNPDLGHWEGEVINRCRDGKLRRVELFISRIHDDAGEPIAFLGMPMDVTERLADELSVRLEYCNVITQLAETRDNETGAHIRRIGLFSGMLARALHLPDRFVRETETFAPHHDIGKVGITDEILLAPRKLSVEEFEVMKAHTLHGYRILQGRATLEIAAEIAYAHHERWDGNGYPRGLRGEEIPLSARIVAVADVYDALRSARPYKRPWSHDSAVRQISQDRGTHFDPAVVDAFLGIADEFARVYAENAG